MSATQNESRREYVRKLQQLDVNASDFEEKFNQIHNAYLPSDSVVPRVRHGHRANARYHDNYNNFNDFFASPFRSLSRMHNHLYKMMNINNFFNDDEIFLKSDEFNIDKLDNLDVATDKTDNNKSNNGYYKYVSSMTTYDNNGIRKAKSISRTEKYDGKHKSVKQVSKFQDGDKYIEEHLNPDGTTRRIEKKIDNQKMIE